MAATGYHRSAGLLLAFALAAGLALLQVLIGGRGLLFPLPGYALLAAAALLGVWIVGRSRTPADTFCLYATAVFCGYIGVRALFSPGYFARPDLLSAAGALVVYGLTTTVLTSSRARLAVVLTLLGVGLIHVMIGAIQFSQGNNFMLIPFLQRTDYYGERASGFYICPNHLAGLLEVLGIFGLALTCWGRLPLWSKLVIGYATGLCYAGLALTGSRGGYLSVLGSVLAFAIISLLILRAAYPRRWLKFGAFGATALLAVALFGAVLIYQSAFLSARAGNIADRNNMRMDLWSAAIQQWHLQPIVGTGAGTYRFYGREFRTEQMQNDPIDVHNDYLHLLCEYGLFGVAAFLVFFYAHSRQGWRCMQHQLRSAEHGHGLLSTRRALCIGALCSIAAYVVHSAFDFNLHVPANAMLLAFVFALVAHPSDSRRPEESKDPLGRYPQWATAGLAVILLVLCARYYPGEYYMERARTALRDEDAATSIMYANKALQYERHNPELYFYLGRALMASSRQVHDKDEHAKLADAAIEALKRAHTLEPLDGSYVLSLAFAYDEMARFEEAERMYAIARARDPRSQAVTELYQAHLESREKVAASGPAGAP